MSEMTYNSFDSDVQPSVLYTGYKTTVLRAPSQPLIFKKNLLKIFRCWFNFTPGVLDQQISLKIR